MLVVGCWLLVVITSYPYGALPRARHRLRGESTTAGGFPSAPYLANPKGVAPLLTTLYLLLAT